MYWAVGRGILNKIPIYSGLFESKPPGIFLISALSLWLTDGFYLTHILQCVAILTIAISPLLPLWLDRASTSANAKVDLLWRAIQWAISIGFGLVLSIYAAERSGEVQVESFGAAFGCLYAVLCSATRTKNPSRFSIFSSSILILAACILKEPFALILLGINLVFANSYQKIIKLFFLPLIFAGAIGLVILYFFSDITFYLSNYFPYMMLSHIERFGSPWVRSMDFNRVLGDLFSFSFSWGLLILLLSLRIGWIFGEKIFRINSQEDQHSPVFLNILKFTLTFILPCFVVGLGGEYYNHHFVFAVPIYLAFFIHFQNQGKFTARDYKLSLGAISVLLVTLATYHQVTDYKGQMQFLEQQERIARSEANYIDSVLDRTGINSYLFIGFNGPQIYGWTKHSPFGPMFAQNNDWIKLSTLRNSFLWNLENAKIIVVVDLNPLGDLRPVVENKLRTDFTEEPWSDVKSLSRQEKTGKIYFKKLTNWQ